MIRRESEIIVRRKIRDAFTIEYHRSSATLLHRAHGALEPRCLQRHQLFVQHLVNWTIRARLKACHCELTAQRT